MPSSAKKHPPAEQAPGRDLRLMEAVRWYDAGNRAEARRLSEALLKEDEKNADAWHLMGLCARLDGRHDYAVGWLKKAVEYAPRSVEFRNNLANTLKEAGRVPEAVIEYQKALQEEPKNAVLHNNLGSAYTQQRKWDAARKEFTEATKLAPDYADAFYNLAVVHNVLGEKDAKIAACRQAVRLRPNYGYPWHMLAQSNRWKEKDADVEAMQRAFSAETTPAEDKVHLGFALGKVFEDIGDYTTAARYLREANRMRRLGYTFDIHHTEAQFAWIKRVFTAEWIAERRKHGHEDATPVFILGLPRSGTSLIEQILAEHPDIHGGGELPFLRDLLHQQEMREGRPYPATVAGQDGKTLAGIGERYAKLLHPLAPGAARVTDKLPGNFPHAGLIAAILPRAKIIHVRRDPLDNGWSLYKRLFGDAVPYAYDLYEIGVMTRHYRDLMAHWEKVLPEGVMLTVDYEEVVKDVEGATRRMLEFLGLPWDARCLKFHESTRPVTTASAEQVRQPIYNSAIGIAARYDRYLTPLKAGLAAE